MVLKGIHFVPVLVEPSAIADALYCVDEVLPIPYNSDLFDPSDIAYPDVNTRMRLRNRPTKVRGEVLGLRQPAPSVIPTPIQLTLQEECECHGFVDFTSINFNGFLWLYHMMATEADPLAAINLNYVAIVCLREEQAEKAAKVIRERSGAQVDVITATTAGAETTHACHADVVIFVWMASTHAVFRAFDGFDRTRFCYVQGTGSSSIVRALERWTLYRL